MSAFTLVELVVVITVIVIVLAVAVPGLSAMNAEARMTAATQIANGALTRAYYLAIGDANLTALRFLPAEWDSDPNAAAFAGRQRLAIYSYAGYAYNPNDPNAGIQYSDYLVRRDGVESVVLPQDIWAAPVEALAPAQSGSVPRPRSDGKIDTIRYTNLGRDFVLQGAIGEFNIDAGVRSPAFLNADDFLIVIDPKTGVYSGTPRPFRMRAYRPPLGSQLGQDLDATGNAVFQRYSFSGVIFYRREPFVALGATADGGDRQNLLRNAGQPFVAQRYSARLTAMTP